jgi:carbonic anhydrase
MLKGAQTFEMSNPIDIEIHRRINRLLELAVTPEVGLVVGELAVLEAIRVMVALKNPERIILMSHTHCGAAQALRMSDRVVRQNYSVWKKTLSRAFPHIPIAVKHDRHSECGEHHHGHEEIFLEAA